MDARSANRQCRSISVKIAGGISEAEKMRQERARIGGSKGISRTLNGRLTASRLTCGRRSLLPRGRRNGRHRLTNNLANGDRRASFRRGAATSVFVRGQNLYDRPIPSAWAYQRGERSDYRAESRAQDGRIVAIAHLRAPVASRSNAATRPVQSLDARTGYEIGVTRPRSGECRRQFAGDVDPMAVAAQGRSADHI